MAPRRLKLGKLPDALGKNFGSIPNDETSKQKDSTSAPLFSFLGKDASKKHEKVSVDIEVFPLQKGTGSNKTQAERSTLLSGTKRHGKRKKVKKIRNLASKEQCR